MRTNRRRRTHPVVRAIRRTLALVVSAVALATAAAGVVGALSWARAHPYFAVREIEVEVDGKLDPKVVLGWARLQTGMSVWDVSAREVERRLKAQPRIRDAAVERRLPNQVEVKIEERRAIAILLASEPLLVSDDGVPFPPLAGETAAGLPYVSGLAGKDLSAGPVVETLRRAARLIELWQEHADWPELSEVRAEGEHLMLHPQRTPMVIRFAAESGAGAEELSRLAAVLELWRGRESEVAAIDLSLPGQALLRLRNPKTSAKTSI
ncbi:MAG: cell division protein FtsQ/DivIB [Candidatus Binatia bacterium]